MESLEIAKHFWKDKSVIITGHTGFKGGWLSAILNSLGANVHGFSLAPDNNSIFFKSTNLSKKIVTNSYGDIRDYKQFEYFIKNSEPEIIFHMAAQPLVRASYKNPIDTFNTNIMGVANLFEISRDIKTLKAIINITTDKCYENKEKLEAYKEDEPLGGYDPYSSSKACSEIVTSAYRKSFLNDLGIQVATARAGNVIGGGDWSEDRLIPDILRAIKLKNKVRIRYPSAIRPWQHVLEPVTGYLMLAMKLYDEKNIYNEAWNFGPEAKDCVTVKEIASKIFNISGIEITNLEIPNSPQPHEAGLLKLDSTKSKNRINWVPRLRVEEAILYTLKWHESFESGEDMFDFSINQFKEYLNK